MEVHRATDTRCQDCDGCLSGKDKHWIILRNGNKILLCEECLEELYWKIDAIFGLG